MHTRIRHFPRAAALTAAAGTISGPALAADTGVQSGSFAIVLIGAAVLLVAALLLYRRASGFLWGLRRRNGQRRLLAAVGKAGLEHLDRFLLPGQKDTLARIDLAVLTSGGIVCLRVMHQPGVIFGKAPDPQWSHVHGTVRRSFLNPVIQNDGRARALQRIVADMPVTSLVVFTGNVQFAVTPPDNVIHVSELAAWLTHYHDSSDCARDPDAAWMSLRAAALTDAASQKDFDALLSFG